MATKRKQQQWLIFLLVIAIAAGLFVVTSSLLNGQNGTLISVGQSGRIDTRIVADRTSGASPEDVWIGSTNQLLVKLQNQNEVLGQKLEAMSAENQTRIENLEADFEAKLKQQAETAINYVDGVTSLDTGTGQQTGGLQPEPVPATLDVAALSTGDGAIDEFIAGSGRTTQLASSDPVIGQTASSQSTGDVVPKPFRTTFNLNPRPEPKTGFKRKTLGNYVPAGSYAPGLVLTGAEAKTGTQNAQSPVPVVIKITGPAVGPSDGTRGTHIDLTGCRATGSAIGDLSSERVSVRLDSLSCVRGSDVYEAPIAAYVSNSGQQGVRGRLYSRAAPAVSNAAIAAALEGFGSAISGTGTTVIGADGAGAADILRTAPLAAAGGAAQGAASKLADYYIDRAEEIAPVVSLYAGTYINIVFLEGADLSGGTQ